MEKHFSPQVFRAAFEKLSKLMQDCVISRCVTPRANHTFPHTQHPVLMGTRRRKEASESRPATKHPPQNLTCRCLKRKPFSPNSLSDLESTGLLGAPSLQRVNITYGAAAPDKPVKTLKHNGAKPPGPSNYLPTVQRFPGNRNRSVWSGFKSNFNSQLGFTAEDCLGLQGAGVELFVKAMSFYPGTRRKEMSQALKNIFRDIPANT